ncbi:MAG: NfeD family protein [Pseudomonadota bacterium]
MFELFGVEISPAMAWLAAGLALLLLELLTGSLWLLWPGISALVFAAVAFFAPELGFGVQVLLFALLAGLLTLLGQRYLEDKVRSQSTDRPHLNDRRAQLIGKTVSAIAAFENGYGAVRLADGQWSARLDDDVGAASVAADDKLTIRDVEGSLLVVAPLAATLADAPT